MTDIDQLKGDLIAAIAAAGGLDSLEAVRVHALGKQGVVTGLLKTLGGMSPEERQAQGPRIHDLREGVTQAQLDALPDWQAAEVFGPRERAVLAYCDAMTRTIHVDPGVFADLRGHFDPRAIVELTATIGAYNMVSRFLEAIGIDSADDKGVVR